MVEAGEIGGIVVLAVALAAGPAGDGGLERLEDFDVDVIGAAAGGDELLEAVFELPFRPAPLAWSDRPLWLPVPDDGSSQPA